MKKLIGRLFMIKLTTRKSFKAFLLILILISFVAIAKAETPQQHQPDSYSLNAYPQNNGIQQNYQDYNRLNSPPPNTVDPQTNTGEKEESPGIKVWNVIKGLLNFF
jgi:hypothetical protein